MDESDPVTLTLVMALATTLVNAGAMQMDDFIESIRRYALQIRAAGDTGSGEALLSLASQISMGIHSPKA